MGQTPAALVVDLSRDSDGVTVGVTGELDMATARPLVAAVCRALEGTDHILLTLDLAGVDFCDSAGISALVGARQACVDQGSRLRLVRLQANVGRVIQLAGLGEYLDVQ